ncbi:hypothetical protein caldi_14650 [Caldinitratiruptor microaerophilus]|uniref:Uncharacterized protein n=1 Tax=Caldinitratiruptor microaerophilus TaxID=671077 RepID=A0AA35CJE8_9FIRM|nr:hypothetical protein caldi_14650 [Caldinitratiruptor microaerophilus]
MHGCARKGGTIAIWLREQAADDPAYLWDLVHSVQRFVHERCGWDKVGQRILGDIMTLRLIAVLAASFGYLCRESDHCC